MVIEDSVRRRGRPRNPAVDEAIVAAARSIMATKGYAGTSMDEIARTAGVGKDTLYRRWASKEDLACHLLAVLASEIRPALDLEDSYDSIFVFLQDMVRSHAQSDTGQIVPGLVGEAVRNEGIAASFSEFWKELRQKASVPILQILPADTTDEELELALDDLLGPIYHRLLLTRAPVSNKYLWELVLTLHWSPTG